MEFVQAQRENVIPLQIRPLREDYPYTIMMLRPYQVKLNGWVLNLRYIFSKDRDITKSKDIILNEELPLYSQDYFYPEDVTVAQVTGAITVDYIYQYGKHGILVSQTYQSTAVNQIEILNVMDY